MNGWATVTLGEVLPFKYGKGLPERVRTHSGEFRVVSSAGFVDTHNEPLTSGPTVVIGRKGSIGTVYYSPDPVYPIDTTFFVEASDRADIRYAYYLLGGMPLDKMNSDSAVPGLNRSHAENLVISFPPLSVQRGIAAILGVLDDKIESNRRAIELSLGVLDAMAARATFDLATVRLSRLVTVTRDSVNPTHLGSQPIDHYSLPAFDNGARPELVPASTVMSNKVGVSRRSILLSRLNPRFNRTWWVSPKDSRQALASTEFSCLTAEDDEALAAVWLALRNKYFMSELARRVTGTSGSHQRIRPADLLSIEVPDVSQLSDSVRSEALSLLEVVEQKRDEIEKLEMLRDALSPELLSGRVQVAEGPALAEAAHA